LIPPAGSYTHQEETSLSWNQKKKNPSILETLFPHFLKRKTTSPLFTKQSPVHVRCTHIHTHKYTHRIQDIKSRNNKLITNDYHSQTTET
jgi:hypothetical protein